MPYSNFYKKGRSDKRKTEAREDAKSGNDTNAAHSLKHKLYTDTGTSSLEWFGQTCHWMVQLPISTPMGTNYSWLQT